MKDIETVTGQNLPYFSVEMKLVKKSNLVHPVTFCLGGWNFLQLSLFTLFRNFLNNGATLSRNGVSLKKCVNVKIFYLKGHVTLFHLKLLFLKSRDFSTGHKGHVANFSH